MGGQNLPIPIDLASLYYHTTVILVVVVVVVVVVNVMFVVAFQVSSYIPQLACYSPDHWGVSLCSIDGQRHSIGDVDVPFTLQSGSRPLNYALAANEVGPEVVHRYVGHEPSGESVSHMRLNRDSKPHNPLINAGAIVVASLMQVRWSLSRSGCVVW